MYDLAAEKALRRRHLLERQRAMAPELLTAAAAAVAARLLACDAYLAGKRIMGYLAFDSEMTIDAFLAAALAAGKEVYVPAIEGKGQMRAARLFSLEQKNLNVDRYGIRCVPSPKDFCPPAALDLIVVPGLAFTKEGGRLGRGAGYYDRFLQKATKAFKLGLCHSSFLEKSLPLEEHDVFLDGVLTEKSFFLKGRALQSEG